ncbi:S8/S53 family peptidase [Sphingomonas sp. DG1-23]|uniref:S8/S53 family peptidase n=1 Tax=Sphingomonas sp. DG1-23 TaxID=3068316 RepID=UPI00273E5363|nr:S8/S53 family peptidase [Sphingomonas sp. DG1-23]MDP5277560.1 S8/S53 family peptidase [Sphingomonas sp. DG1-23]
MNTLLLSLVALLETAAPVAAPPIMATPVVVPPIAAPLARPRVAIIDSGVAKTSELAALVSAEYDMASDPGRTAFEPRYDHGTMVATILARAAHGQVDIISLRIDDPAGCPSGANPPCQPSAAPVVRAIRRAADLGVDAINISLALDPDPSITAAIADAAAKGIRVVLAAGNNGYDHPGNLGPARAAYPNAVLVGAIDSDGKPWSGTNRPDAAPDGYNYAWALGVKVPTAAIDGRAVTGTGTSFAAPLETARFLASRTTAAR